MLSKKSITLVVCVFELVILTTSDLCGEANTIASFLSSAIVIRLSTCVVLPLGPAIINPTSTVSASWNFSYAVFSSPVVTVEPFEPPDNDSLVGVLTAVKVVPLALLPQFEPEVL